MIFQSSLFFICSSWISVFRCWVSERERKGKKRHWSRWVLGCGSVSSREPLNSSNRICSSVRCLVRLKLKHKKMFNKFFSSLFCDQCWRQFDRNRPLGNFINRREKKFSVSCAFITFESTFHFFLFFAFDNIEMWFMRASDRQALTFFILIENEMTRNWFWSSRSIFMLCGFCGHSALDNEFIRSLVNEASTGVFDIASLNRVFVNMDGIQSSSSCAPGADEQRKFTVCIRERLLSKSSWTFCWPIRGAGNSWHSKLRSSN